jgi:MYXO-CTERM domain-containing protein
MLLPAVVSDVSVPEPQPVTSASSGILGALLALAPRSLRRRKKDESAK